MRLHAVLDRLIELEERVGQLYTGLYARFVSLPGMADLWWEMALEEHGHAGILKMVKVLTDPADAADDIRPRLRPLLKLIRTCETRAARNLSVRDALGIAVQLERSELDRLGSETMRGVARGRSIVPRSAFAPHQAHLDRLARTVRKFGGEAVIREAWVLSEDARNPAVGVAERGSSRRPATQPVRGSNAQPARSRRRTRASTPARIPNRD